MKAIISEHNKYEVEIQENGSYSVEVNGNYLSLTSKYSAEAEEYRLIQKFNEEAYHQIYIIFGLGSGNWVNDSTIKDIVEKNTLLIFEPSIQIAKNYTSKIENKNENIILYSGEVTEELLNIIKGLGVSHNNFEIVINGNYKNIFQDEYRLLLESIKKYMYGSVTHLNTMKLHNERFTVNLIRNLFSKHSFMRIDGLKNKYSNIPALIVSAGPSLDKQLEYIKEFNGLIFSGGRTLKTLIEKGVEPDFLVSIDPHHNAYLLVEDNLDAQVPLITAIQSSHEIAALYMGNKILMNSGAIELNKELLGEDIDSIDNGFSVANTIFSITDYMGCEPIVFIGQDLAYTNNKHHSDSTINSKFDKKNDVDDKKTAIKVEGYYGDIVTTTPSLYVFLEWFEKKIKQTNKEIINCTEGGAMIKGTIQMSFQEFLNSKDNKKVQQKEQLKFEYHTDVDVKKERVEEIFEMTQKIVELLFESKRWSDSLNKYYANKDKNISKINRLLKKLDENDAKIMELGRHTTLFSFFFMDAFNDFQKYVQQRSLNEEMTLKKIAESNQIFYEVLHDKTKLFEEEMRKVLGEHYA